MERKTFDPREWLDFEASAAPESERGGDNYNVNDAAGDVENVIKHIEERRLDITTQYAHWRNIGFALASAFGEGGRNYFHRVSCFYPRYTKAECDRQYTSCLKGKGNGVTLKSFFYYAKEAGIDIGGQTGQVTEVKSEEKVRGTRIEVRGEGKEVGSTEEEVGSNQSAEMGRVEEGKVEIKGTEMGDEGMGNNREQGAVEKAQRPVGSMEEKGKVLLQEGEELLPNLPASIYEDLPLFLKKVVVYANSGEERDLLLLGSLAVLSSCLPTFYGIYDGKRVSANLYLFITARASAGKGRLVHCRQLVQPIHYYLRDQTKLLKKEYDLLLSEYNQLKSNDGGEKPNRPPEKMLFIPANNSTTGVFQLLHDNEGRGIIFETEGDTLAHAFKSDYGNYSDGFRKAFHHETISYYRRTDREYVDIESPCISTVLSGTPKQVSALIPNAENGLFSRFMFYFMNIQPVWKDVFSFSDEESLDVYFKKLGEEFFELYKQLMAQEEVQFALTPEQQAQFNQFFTIVQDTYVSLKGLDYLATVRRLGLIAFRISMIFSALRLMEHGTFQKHMVCTDRDFQLALSIVRVLVKHAAKVYSELPEDEPLPKRNNRKERFFESLQKEFSRKDFLTAGTRIGIPNSTAERYILEFCKCGMVINADRGRYQKKITSELQV